MWFRSWSLWSICPIYRIQTMFYLPDICYLDHDLSDLPVRSIWSIHDLSVRHISSRSWSIWYICPTYLIYIMIYLVYLSFLPHLDHDISVRHISSRSWSIWYICPIYLIYFMIYLSDLSDVDHDTSDLSVRSIWSIHDLPVLYMWLRSWSISSICAIYLI